MLLLKKGYTEKVMTIRIYFIKSTGKLLMLYNIVRNDPRGNVVEFTVEKEVIFYQQVFFFLHYFHATSTSNWAQIFTGLLFCA